MPRRPSNTPPKYYLMLRFKPVTTDLSELEWIFGLSVLTYQCKNSSTLVMGLLVIQKVFDSISVE